MRPTIAFLALLSSGCSGCGGTGRGDGTDTVTLDPSEFTYRLEESTSGLVLWTTPCTHKVRSNERAPGETRPGLHLSAARREFEPVQVVMGPGSGSVSVEMDPFPGLGSSQRIEVSRARYEDGWAERLEPVPPGSDVALSGGQGVPLWITVRVPDDAPAGEHETTLHLSRSGTTVEVPVGLRVFDFEIPAAIGYATQMNVSIPDLIPEGGDVDDAKTLLHEHRLTPKGVTWPSGFGWNITWDTSASSDRCEILWDEPDEPDEYSIGWLARRYILGEGWNGVGFPNAMIFQFVDNSTPRPDELCGILRGDHYGSTEYNAEWSQFLSALETYLEDGGLIDKAYYYVQNEPQDDTDHELAAFLCDIARSAAPGLRIAVSEEPKPEIAEDPAHGCGYDIWIAHVRAYEQGYAWQRQRDNGEEVWFYSLNHDPDPYFNPTRVDVQGMHERIIPWVSWHYRATGWAYYDANRFFDGPRPTIRAELLREGIEDYEYLLLANGGAPTVYATEPVDATVDSVASSLTSWTRDADALMALRHALGLYIEGTTDTLPVLETDTHARPRGAYHLNFQDPSGRPTAEPLTVDGTAYMKVGWSPYGDDEAMGWYGEFIDDPSIALHGFDDVPGYSVVEQSYIYDDYGRDNLFEFALENGTYEVTIGVGRPARGYPSDPHNVTLEGITVVDDEPTSDGSPTIRRTVTVDLHDGSLSLVVGGRSASTGEFAYTFLAYMDIAPAD